MLLDQPIALVDACDMPAAPEVRQPEALMIMRRLAAEIDASSFGAYLIGATAEARRLVPLLDREHPRVSALTRAVTARGADNFAHALSETSAPLWWRTGAGVPLRCTKARCWSSEIAAPFVDGPGIAFPVSHDDGQLGVVIFSGPAIALSEDDLCDVHSDCFVVIAEIMRQRGRVSDLPTMSRREIECLRLTANGLTSEEIATALGLSVHTANQYLTNTTHKLDAVNRIHAVAKALRNGLID